MADLTTSSAVDTFMQATNAAQMRAALGTTTVGDALCILTNPGAITFLRVNADNSVTALSAADFKTALSITTFDPASPGAIGGTTPGAGAFTTLSIAGVTIAYQNTYGGNGLRVNQAGDLELSTAAGGGIAVPLVRDAVANAWRLGSTGLLLAVGSTIDFAGNTLISSDSGALLVGAGGLKFPSADPHVAGAWWDNAGTLTRSAG
jgi:hypothetical protein